MRIKICLLVLSHLMLLGLGFSASIGTVPGNLNLGTVERGSTYESEIYLTVSDFPQEDIRLNPAIGPMALIELNDEGNQNRYSISEEEFSEWVEFENLSFNSSTTETIQLEEGAVNADGKLILNLIVPRDAEPGHHYGKIELNPQIDTGGGGGTLNWGETQPRIQFRVPGNANRQISIDDIRGFRNSRNKAIIELLISNRGSVTTSVNTFEANILDSKRNQEAILTVGGGKLPPNGPNSSRWFDAVWTSSNKVPEGTYQIDGNANYITGSATAAGTFTLPGINKVEVRPEEDDAETQGTGGDFPLWFVIIVLSILGVLMWGFEIEPFWITTVLGILGTSAFIIISGVPNYVMAILFIVVAVVIYGGM
jgi:hypothetical protein